MGRWNLAAIFKPTKTRVVLAVIFYPILYLLLTYSVMQIDYVSKNNLLVMIGCIVNVVPVLFIWLFGILIMNNAIPFPVDALLLFLAYFVIPGLWAYFWSCIAIGFLSARKRTKSE